MKKELISLVFAHNGGLKNAVFQTAIIIQYFLFVSRAAGTIVGFLGWRI
jgi:hypothetical protein